MQLFGESHEAAQMTKFHGHVLQQSWSLGWPRRIAAEVRLEGAT